MLAPFERAAEEWILYQAEDGIRDIGVTGVQTCALPICRAQRAPGRGAHHQHPRARGVPAPQLRLGRGRRRDRRARRERLHPRAGLARAAGRAVTRTSERREALLATAAAQGLDAVLITNLLNVRYLTGFTGSNGALLVRTDGADLFGTDGRYTTQAAGQVPDVELVVDRSTVAGLAAEAVRRGAGRIGYESHDLPVDGRAAPERVLRSEEHTSELQSRPYLGCRFMLG